LVGRSQFLSHRGNEVTVKGGEDKRRKRKSRAGKQGDTEQNEARKLSWGRIGRDGRPVPRGGNVKKRARRRKKERIKGGTSISGGKGQKEFNKR